MRRKNTWLRIPALVLPVLLALLLSACSLFGGKEKEVPGDAAETAPAGELTGERAEEMPRPAEEPGKTPEKEEAEKAPSGSGEARLEAPAGGKEEKDPSSYGGAAETEGPSWTGEEKEPSQDDFLEPPPAYGGAEAEPDPEPAKNHTVTEEDGVTLLPEVP